MMNGALAPGCSPMGGKYLANVQKLRIFTKPVSSNSGFLRLRIGKKRNSRLNTLFLDQTLSLLRIFTMVSRIPFLLSGQDTDSGRISLIRRKKTACGFLFRTSAG